MVTTSANTENQDFLKILSTLRHLGLGVKQTGENLEFVGNDHKEIYEEVINVLKNKNKLSGKTRERISSLLGESGGDLSLENDLLFAEWMLKAENFVFDNKIKVIKDDSRLDGKGRTTPFHFTENHKIDAEKAYEFLRGIGLNVEWQLGTHLSFWLREREFSRKETIVRNRTKRHPVSNILESMGIPGHEIDNGFYYVNNVANARINLMNKSLSEEGRVAKIPGIVKKFEEAAKGSYTTKPTQKGFTYKEVITSGSNLLKSSKGNTLHPVSAACDKLGLSGGGRNGEKIYYSNQIAKGVIMIQGTASIKTRKKKAAKVYEEIQKICPGFKFTYREGFANIKYEEVKPAAPEISVATYIQGESESGKKDVKSRKRFEPSHKGNDFIDSFSREQWLMILARVPAEILLEKFPQLKDTGDDKKILDKIRKSYHLIEKSGLAAKTTNPEFLKEVDDVV